MINKIFIQDNQKSNEINSTVFGEEIPKLIPPSMATMDSGTTGSNNAACFWSGDNASQTTSCTACATP